MAGFFQSNMDFVSDRRWNVGIYQCSWLNHWRGQRFYLILELNRAYDCVYPGRWAWVSVEKEGACHLQCCSFVSDCDLTIEVLSLPSLLQITLLSVLTVRRSCSRWCRKSDSAHNRTTTTSNAFQFQVGRLDLRCHQLCAKWQRMCPCPPSHIQLPSHSPRTCSSVQKGARSQVDSEMLAVSF